MKHWTLNPGNGVRASGGAPCGSEATGRPREPKPRGMRVRLASPVLMPAGLTGRTPRSGCGRSWFESTAGSDAAAHGCGPAFVRRAVRIGTGRRLQCPRSPTGRRHQPEAPGVCVVGSHRGHEAFVAHQVEQPFCKRQAARSSRAEGSQMGGRGKETRPALIRETPGSSPGRPASSLPSRSRSRVASS